MELLLNRALAFATEAHDGQTRKGSGEPYINHPVGVKTILETLFPEASVEMKIAALLHDVIEDTPFTRGDIDNKFGTDVGTLVYWLSNDAKPSDGNRKARVEINKAKLAKAPFEPQIIKCADIIHNNINSESQLGASFSKTYKLECLAKLHSMSDLVKQQNIWKAAIDATNG
jgi:(p)ppGpp synthase/HD superfamily hydrolase